MICFDFYVFPFSKDINGIAKSLMKLEKKFGIRLKEMENVFDRASKLNKESRSHLEECVMLESSNHDVIAEAEQKLHSLQEEEKRVEHKQNELAKVIHSRLLNVSNC